MSEGGTLHQCLQDIQRADTSGDYQKALLAANRMIRRYPKEICAFKCKLVALIHLQQYNDALELIRKTPPSQMGECAFEKAYCFYRLGKLEESVDVLESCNDSDFRSLELRAQVFYKLDEFSKAYDTLCLLLKNHSDEFDEERRVNLLAIQTQLESRGVKQTVEDGHETYEQMYNAACQLVESGKYKKALLLLEKAEGTCKTSLSEQGYSEEEMEEDLSIIRVQRAYALQKLGRNSEALEVYKSIRAAGCSDIGVKVTLINNIPSASEDCDPADARRSFKALQGFKQDRLTSRQRQTLLLNNALLQLMANQREPCRRAIEELHSKYGQSKESKLILAALYAKQKDIQKAVEVLNDTDLESLSSRIHILVNYGRYEDALNTLEKLPTTASQTLGASSLRSFLLIKLGRSDNAIKEIQAAVSEGSDSELLLKQGADLESSRQNWLEAAKYLEQLAKKTPADLSIQGLLVRAYSHFDKTKADELCKKLFPDSVSTSANVDELEDSDWILYGEKYVQKKEAKMEVDSEIITRKLKNRKRKRKIRFPKNYDPEVLPDPERWLPKQERAAYKKRFRKNRDRDIGRGTQGSSVNPAVEYSAPTPQSPRAVGASVAEGPRQMRPKAQPKKKKKPAKF